MTPDLSPRRASLLEWWFFQGQLEAESSGKRDFMLSFFRQGSGEDDGYKLIVSVFDHTSETHHSVSEVSQALVDHFLARAPEEVKGVDISQHLVDAFLG